MYQYERKYPTYTEKIDGAAKASFTIIDISIVPLRMTRYMEIFNDIKNGCTACLLHITYFVCYILLYFFISVNREEINTFITHERWTKSSTIITNTYNRKGYIIV